LADAATGERLRTPEQIEQMPGGAFADARMASAQAVDAIRRTKRHMAQNPLFSHILGGRSSRKANTPAHT